MVAQFVCVVLFCLTCAWYALPIAQALAMLLPVVRAMNGRAAKSVTSLAATHFPGRNAFSRLLLPPRRHYSVAVSSSQFWSDSAIWRRARVNTARCLVGCSIGDLSMLWYLSCSFPDMSSASTMVLSCSAGLFTSVALETGFLHWTDRFGSVSVAFRTAMKMSFASMLMMELSENAVALLILSRDLQFFTDVTGNPHWMLILPLSSLVGFAIPLPYNYFLLKRYGRGCH